MPNNFAFFRKELKKDFQEVAEDVEKGLSINQLSTLILLNNLARFTPVDKGRLSAGYRVVIDGSGRTPETGERIRTRTPSANNLARIKLIKGNSKVDVVNVVYYAKWVNDGTRHHSPQNFREKAMQATVEELQARITRGLK